jgi:hypothetical protein
MVERPDNGTPPSMPRWVKVFGIVVIVLIVIVVIGLLIGGNHGPGRHLGFRPTDGQSVHIGHEWRTS